MLTDLSCRHKKITTHQRVDETAVCFWQVVGFSLGVILLGAIVFWWTWNKELSRAFVMGAMVSILNFSFLKWQLEYIVKNYQSPKSLFVILLGYIIRFSMMGLFLFFMGREGISFLLSAGFGLLTVRIAIFIYGIFGKI